MRQNFAASIAFFVLLPLAMPASAASLQVAPVSIEVPASGAATTLTLQNPSTTPLKAQIRLYRWSVVNGVEHLDPTSDVVASPPVATLLPNTNYTVRVVRVSKAPRNSEETYRLIVDEIPDPSARKKGTVTLAFRYSIPAFFAPASAAAPDLKWSLERRDGKLYVSATNTGGRRVRIVDLKMADGNGKTATVAKGLAGYVLARSSKSWVAPGAMQMADLQPLQITAQGDVGPINARVLPQASR